MFTFATEATDSANAVDGSAALIAGMEITARTAAFVTDPADVQLLWFDGATFDTTFSNAVDVKSTFSAAGAPIDQLAAVYSGRYACVNFLITDGAGDFDINTNPAAADDGTTCPNSNGLTGSIEFLLADPIIATAGIVVFLHGITRDKTDVAAIANAFAAVGFATIAIDIWGHGSRIYQIAGADVPFFRPDDPAKTVGYLYQTRSDIQRLHAIADNNLELLATALGTNATAPVFFVGQSLGGIIGALATSSGTTVFTRSIFNVAGADLIDIVLKGDIGDVLIAEVGATLGLEVGSADLNATLLGIELASRHALFAGLADPLAVYDPATPTLPADVLVQQMTGDSTIANDNTELLSRVMGLTTHNDGAGPQAGGRKRWIYDPANYSTDADGNPPGHGFLLDGLTTATTQGQTQAVGYLLAGGLSDPSQ